MLIYLHSICIYNLYFFHILNVILIARSEPELRENFLWLHVIVAFWRRYKYIVWFISLYFVCVGVAEGR